MRNPSRAAHLAQQMMGFAKSSTHPMIDRSIENTMNQQNTVVMVGV
jgi:hypothetical protein